MDNSADNGTIPVMTQEPYKGESPRLAAFTAGLAKAAFEVPFMWVVNGVVNLASDKLFSKTPFKENTWARFKRLDSFFLAISGAFIAYDMYKDGKTAYRKAEEAESQHNQLAFENQIFRTQLVEAGVKPNAIQSIHRTVHPALGDDAPATPPAHAAKLEAARAAEALAAATSPSTAIH